MNRLIEISSSKNPIIKEIKNLYRRRDRWENQLFIMEGIKLIDEAILNNVNLKYIIYTNKLLLSDEGNIFFNRINDYHNLINVTDNLFKEVSDTDNPQGVLAVGSFTLNAFADLVTDPKPALIFLDNLQDPGNMGTIIRSADAFGLDGIILGEGCVDPYNPKVIRATMGSIFRVPLYFVKDNLGSLIQLKGCNYNIYSTSLEGSISNYDADYYKSFVIIIGNESKGVDSKIINLSDLLIKIPMPGKAESLNAGVAASIVMYEAMKQIGK